MVFRRRRGSVGERLLNEVLEMRGEQAEIKATLGNVLKQTTLTNGRVTSLEDFRDNHDHTVALDNAVTVTRKLVRAEDRARLLGAWDFLTDDFLKVAPPVLFAIYFVGHYLLHWWR